MVGPRDRGEGERELARERQKPRESGQRSEKERHGQRSERDRNPEKQVDGDRWGDRQVEWGTDLVGRRDKGQNREIVRD